jgi:hypothetical protein
MIKIKMDICLITSKSDKDVWKNMLGVCLKASLTCYASRVYFLTILVIPCLVLKVVLTL